MPASTAPQRIHKLVPDLPMNLSAEAEAQVAELSSRRGALGTAHPNACLDTQAIRRDTTRDFETVARPPFVRDAEKIMHIPAYNRMVDKTQVFSFRQNDDISRRSLHVQLVCRIARDIGRSLGLNEDLIEAIALGHDLGHTPFGHAGEKFLDASYHESTGRWFRHNVQSVRVLDVLYGRNITLQTLDGIICHNGEFEQQKLQLSELATLPADEQFPAFDAIVERCWVQGDSYINHMRPSTLEGCVVRLSDIIAYVGKDRQDAIIAGVANADDFDDGLGGSYNAWALTAFSTDIIEHSLGHNHICMSEEAFGELARAKRENYAKIYGKSESNGESSAALQSLFSLMYERVKSDLRAGDTSTPIFRHHIEPLERYLQHYGRSYDWQDDLDLTAVDFISSMSDTYFTKYARILYPDVSQMLQERGYLDDLSVNVEIEAFSEDEE